METRSATRRSVRLNKVKPPRPRRSISEPAPVPDDPNIKIIESLHQKLIDCIACHTDVSEFLDHVMTNGKPMEIQLKDRLDGLFDVIRLSMMESQMETCTRMHLLQLLELRAGGWQVDESRSNFYKHKCRCLGMKWRSNSDSSDVSIQKPSALKPRRETDDTVTHDKAAGDMVTVSKMPQVFDANVKKPTVPKPRKNMNDTVTHDKAAGDTVTLSKTARMFDISDTVTHAKMSALYGAGEPQSNTCIIPPPLNVRNIPLPPPSTRDIPLQSNNVCDIPISSIAHNVSSESKTRIVPPPPGLQRCTSVPSDVATGSDFLRFRSLSDRCFLEPVAPAPWNCSSSVLELSRLGNDMRGRSGSTSPEPDTDQECITYTGEVLLSFAESPHARVPPEDWSYLSKVFPEVCHTQVDDYFHASSYVPPQWNFNMLRHSTKKDNDVSSSVIRGGFPCSKRQDGDGSSAVIRGGFPCSKRQDGDGSSAVIRGGFPCSKRQDVDVSSAVIRGGFSNNTEEDVDVSSTVIRGGFPNNTKQDVNVSSTVIRGGFPNDTKQDVDVSTTVIRGGFPNDTKQDVDVSSTVIRGGFPNNTKQDVHVSSTVIRGGFPSFTKQDDDITSTVVRRGFPGFTKQSVDVSSSLVRGFPG